MTDSRYKRTILIPNIMVSIDHLYSLLWFIRFNNQNHKLRVTPFPKMTEQLLKNQEGNLKKRKANNYKLKND